MMSKNDVEKYQITRSALKPRNFPDQGQLALWISHIIWGTYFDNYTDPMPQAQLIVDYLPLNLQLIGEQAQAYTKPPLRGQSKKLADSVRDLKPEDVPAIKEQALKLIIMIENFKIEEVMRQLLEKMPGRRLGMRRWLGAIQETGRLCHEIYDRGATDAHLSFLEEKYTPIQETPTDDYGFYHLHKFTVDRFSDPFGEEESENFSRALLIFIATLNIELNAQKTFKFKNLPIFNVVFTNEMVNAVYKESKRRFKDSTLAPQALDMAMQLCWFKSGQDYKELTLDTSGTQNYQVKLTGNTLHSVVKLLENADLLEYSE